LGIAIIGIAVGILGAAGTGGVLRSMVYGVSTADPLTFACVSFLFLVIAFLANFIPSRRAIRVPPAIALRSS
jgi:ABC-type antimicrobial peptide transport system permease subunit